jgi:hypothetical protein
MGFIVRRISPNEWRLVREVRLRALSDAPYAFDSTLEEESDRDDSFWKGAVERLAWFLAIDGKAPVGVVALLPAKPNRPETREVISVWVSPEHRVGGWVRPSSPPQSASHEQRAFAR